MGLLGDMFGGLRMKDPVRGTAQVVSCTGHRGDGVMQNCRMQLVVRGEGVPAKAVEHSGLVHFKRWPSPGMTLPVTVDRANPERVKVEWDEVESTRDRAEAAAEGLAATMRGEEQPAAAGFKPHMINLTGGDLSELSEAQRAKLRMLGLDPGSLPAGQGESDSLPPASEGAVGKRIERLERLAKLHEQGVLTDSELEEQKRQVLGD